MELEPYLYFGGTCEEALTFYKEVFAGEVVALMRFRETDGTEIPPGYEGKVMHSIFKSPTLTFMAADEMPTAPESSAARVSLSLSTRDVAEGERVFAMLSAGGTIAMPMSDTFWGARLGKLVDKFGIHWMVHAEKG